MNPVYVYRRRHRIVQVASEKARRLGRPVLGPTRTLTRRGKRFGRTGAKRLLGIARRLPHTLAVHGIPVTTNDRRLAALKGRHRGRRCFVIGNGPSLRLSDLDRLNDEVTFASNKIYLAFDETDWRPTFYTIEDPLVGANIADEVKGLNGMTKIFPADLRNLLRPERDTVYVDLLGRNEDIRHFSADARRAIYWGSTVTYMNIELAFFAGCDPVYLIGVDFSFKVPDTVEGSEIVSQGERNWFHPDYRPAGERWFLPRLDRQTQAFELAKAFCERSGRTIYNATRGGKLEIFSRVDFDSLLPPVGIDGPD